MKLYGSYDSIIFLNTTIKDTVIIKFPYNTHPLPTKGVNSHSEGIITPFPWHPKTNTLRGITPTSSQ